MGYFNYVQDGVIVTNATTSSISVFNVSIKDVKNLIYVNSFLYRKDADSFI